jgi:hypothetical protein
MRLIAASSIPVSSPASQAMSYLSAADSNVREVCSMFTEGLQLRYFLRSSRSAKLSHFQTLVQSFRWRVQRRSKLFHSAPQLARAAYALPSEPGASRAGVRQWCEEKGAQLTSKAKRSTH